MKKSLLAISFFVFLSHQVLLAQSEEFQIINYTEFFGMMDQEETDQFRLNNTIVTYNATTDSLYWYTHNPSLKHEMRSDTIQIDKKIFLTNVHFEASGSPARAALFRFHFSEDVALFNCGSVIFDECVFDGQVDFFIEQTSTTQVSIANNEWPEYVFLRADGLNNNANIGWKQLDNRLFSSIGMTQFDNWDGYSKITIEETDSLRREYVNSAFDIRIVLSFHSQFLGYIEPESPYKSNSILH